MISYRDTTYCSYYSDCKHGEGCYRALTPAVVCSAKRWWKDLSGDAPISTFAEKPTCYENKVGATP